MWSFVCLEMTCTVNSGLRQGRLVQRYWWMLVSFGIGWNLLYSIKCWTA